MAAKQETHDEELDHDPNYKAPAVKSLQEIVSSDSADESLRRYKEALLGGASAGSAAIPFPNDPRKVIVTKLSVLVDGRPPMEINLQGDISNLRKEHPLTLKEGVTYRVRISFFVQREIVAGLKYIQKIHRGPIQVDKMDLMVGSYPPKTEPHDFTTGPEEAPQGMLARGTYKIHSKFTDDDKHDHLTWEWALEIKKDWD